MLSRVLRLYVSVTLMLGLLSTGVFAHPGRLDKNGGHWNRKTGEYHYHRSPGWSSDKDSNSTGSARETIQAPLPVYTPPRRVPAIVVNGQSLQLAADPVLEEGRVLVPLRGVFEALGATVFWDSATQTVHATKGSRAIRLRPGERTAMVRDQSVGLDVPARITGGYTLVPLRFIAEALGAEVKWDAATWTVSVTGSTEADEKPKTSQAIPPGAVDAKVARVVDGDTIEIEGGEKVRLIGVNTPETKDPRKPVEYFGQEAYEFTKSLLEGKDVYLEYDVEKTDRYGRILAYIYLADGTFVNAELVKQGYAQVMTIPPNVKYADLFVELQREAREADKGLWGLPADSPSSSSSSPAPAPAPTKTQGLQLVNVTSPVSPGDYATVTVKTSPGAQASITVYYKSGPSKAAGLEPKTAGPDGTVSWTWKVGSRTTPGVWRIEVRSEGETLRVPFEVR